MKPLSICLFIFFTSTTTYGAENFTLMLESGAVWQNRNDTKISPFTGTRIPIDEFSTGAEFHYRLEAFYKINNRSSLRALYAPLDLSVTGRRNTSTNFNGVIFNSQDDLRIRYKFNSYRLSYIYSFWDSETDKLNLGITLKVRDAVTSFSQRGLIASYDNVGFVPLIYFEYQKALTPEWRINLSLDGAYASQGRAIDASLKIRRDLSEASDLGFGVRTLEGGADNDEVFTFSWFTYAVADISLKF